MRYSRGFMRFWIATAVSFVLGSVGVMQFIAAGGPDLINGSSTIWFLVAAIGFMAGLFLTAAAFHGEQFKRETFGATFGFDPRPHKQELVGSPQHTVSFLIEQKRLAAQALFEKEIGIQTGKITSEQLTQEFILQKNIARDVFWQACDSAKTWGFRVPRSINEAAIQQSVAA